VWAKNVLSFNPAAVYISLTRYAVMSSYRADAPGAKPYNAARCAIFTVTKTPSMQAYCHPDIAISELWLAGVGWASSSSSRACCTSGRPRRGTAAADPYLSVQNLSVQGLAGRLAGVQPVSGQQRGQRGQCPGPLPVGLRRAEQAFGGTAADDAEHRARLAVV
jgi:hypothetical protein